MRVKINQFLAVILMSVMILGIMPYQIPAAEIQEGSGGSLTVEGNDDFKDVAVLYGDSVTLEVTAQSTVSEVFYQWRSGNSDADMSDISGADQAEYTVAADQNTPRIFECYIWDNEHEDQKTVRRFLINIDPIIIPGAGMDSSNVKWLSARENEELTLSVDAWSPYELTYTWYYREGPGGEWIPLGEDWGREHTLVLTDDIPMSYRCEFRYEYNRKSTIFYLSKKTGPKAVKMELPPSIRDWYIYEQTGEAYGDNDTQVWEVKETNGGILSTKYYYGIKIGYDDGSEGYIGGQEYPSPSSSTIATREDGSWEAGDYSVIYSHDGVSVSQNVHVVRIGVNGTDLAIGQQSSTQTAGETAPEYQYYRIRPQQTDVYQVSLSDVSGSGTVSLYQGNEMENGTLRTHFKPLAEEEISVGGKNRLAYELEGGRDYFLVVRAEGNAQAGYKILFDQRSNELFADTPLDAEGLEKFIFKPEKSGYYSLQYMYETDGKERYDNLSARVFEDGIEIGEVQIRYTLYFHAGRTYTFIPWSKHKTIKISRCSDVEYPSDCVVEGAMGHGTGKSARAWLDKNGILTYEKEEGGSGLEVSSFPLQNQDSVKKLVIGEGIREIDRNSFLNYKNLEEVTLPSTLESIGSNVFSGCTRLSAVHLPQENHLVSIGQESFLSTPFFDGQQGNYKMLGTIVIRYTGEEQETVVPQNATVIGGHSMQNCSTLEKITIQDKVKTIGEFGIADCKSLPGIDVPGNVTDIQYGAFCGDTALEKAVLQEGVEKIGKDAFLACDNLKEIDIPKSVSQIGYNAIGYSRITRGGVYIPSAEPPVVGCYYRTPGYYYAEQHQLPKKLLDEKDLGNKNVAFLHYSAAIGGWPIKVDEIGVSFGEETLTEGVDYTVTRQDFANEKKTVLTVTGIGDYFGSQSVEIKSQPSSSGGSQSGTGQNGGQNNTTGGGSGSGPLSGTVVTDSKTGASYQVTKDSTAEYKKAPKSAKGTVTIPGTIKIGGKTLPVTGIAAGAFKNNKKIKQIKLGSNVTSVGKNAFSGCSKLASVSGGKNIVSIGENAFLRCTALKKIIIYKEVKKIGKKAFSGCKKLKNITVKTTKLTKKNVGKSAFSGTPSNTSVKVPKSRLKTYKTLLRSKGIHKKAKIK